MDELITDLLAELNHLRLKAGRPVLRIWGGTEDQLRAAIRKREEELMIGEASRPDDLLVKDYLAKGGKVTVAPQKKPKRVRMKTGKEIVDREPLTSGTKERGGHMRSVPTGQFALIDLARDLKIAPKKARTLARRHAEKLRSLTTTKGQWIFKDEDKELVTNLLVRSSIRRTR